MRRERDSNSRYQFTHYDGLANRCLRPLGHLSTTSCIGVCPQAGRFVSAVTSLTSGLILPQPVQEVQVKGLSRRSKSLAGSCGGSGVPLKALDVTSGFGEKQEGCRVEVMRQVSRLGWAHGKCGGGGYGYILSRGCLLFARRFY